MTLLTPHPSWPGLTRPSSGDAFSNGEMDGRLTGGHDEVEEVRT